VRLHRAELYDAIGPGMHPCHHCGDLVEWGITLEVDHLDHNRQNNPSRTWPWRAVAARTASADSV